MESVLIFVAFHLTALVFSLFVLNIGFNTIQTVEPEEHHQTSMDSLANFTREYENNATSLDEFIDYVLGTYRKLQGYID